MEKHCWRSKVKKIALTECLRIVLAAVFIVMATYQIALESEIEFRSNWPYFASLALNICVQTYLATNFTTASYSEQEDAEALRLLSNWVMYTIALLCHKITVLAAIAYEHELVLEMYWYVGSDLPVHIGLVYVTHRLVRDIETEDISTSFWKKEQGRLYIKNITRSYDKVPEEDILCWTSS